MESSTERQQFAIANATITLKQLKWLSVGVPIIFVLALVLIDRFVAPEILNSWPGFLVIAVIIICASLGFSEMVFNLINAFQQRQHQQYRELLALHEAGLDIAEELDLETVLLRVVTRATGLVGARYGALSLLTTSGPDGKIADFITYGMTTDEQKAIGDKPVGHGILGLQLAEGEALRLTDLSTHPASCGFPSEHPPMASLLAVPIRARGILHGHLYLTEKIGNGGFTPEDEASLRRFATQAALAISNARLHHLAREVAISEERALLAREMHDNVAQVLGYVNTKGQAAQSFLEQGETARAHSQLTQLIIAAHDAYADLREQILGLRATTDPMTGGGLLEALKRYLIRWQEQSDVPVQLAVEPDNSITRNLPPRIELQLLRIIQEALSNVRKHANAHEATVAFIGQPGQLTITIVDNGVGFDPSALGRAEFPRFGLTGMYERAAAIGAILTVAGTPGQGTIVKVLVPLAD